VKQKERRRARGDGRIGWQRGRGPQFAGRRENDSHRGKRRGVRMGRPKCLARATMRRLIAPALGMVFRVGRHRSGMDVERRRTDMTEDNEDGDAYEYPGR
jgi:hypothetical protein